MYQGRLKLKILNERLRIVNRRSLTIHSGKTRIAPVRRKTGMMRHGDHLSYEAPVIFNPFFLW